MGHLSDNNETYFRHLRFAGKIGLVFIVAGMLFLVHAIMPFIQIPKCFNIEAIQNKVNRWNEYARRRLDK